MQRQVFHLLHQLAGAPGEHLDHGHGQLRIGHDSSAQGSMGQAAGDHVAQGRSTGRVGAAIQGGDVVAGIARPYQVQDVLVAFRAELKDLDPPAADDPQTGARRAFHEDDFAGREAVTPAGFRQCGQLFPGDPAEIAMLAELLVQRVIRYGSGDDNHRDLV